MLTSVNFPTTSNSLTKTGKQVYCLMVTLLTCPFQLSCYIKHGPVRRLGNALSPADIHSGGTPRQFSKFNSRALDGPRCECSGLVMLDDLGLTRFCPLPAIWPHRPRRRRMDRLHPRNEQSHLHFQRRLQLGKESTPGNSKSSSIRVRE